MDAPIQAKERTIVIKDGNLLCPHCACEYLHHYQVTVFNRAEDEKEIHRLTINAEPSSDDRPTMLSEIQPNSSDNPSSRRHGLAIAFSCECCNTVYELTLAQHKGTTEIAWRSIGLAFKR